MFVLSDPSYKGFLIWSLQSLHPDTSDAFPLSYHNNILLIVPYYTMLIQVLESTIPGFSLLGKRKRPAAAATSFELPLTSRDSPSTSVPIGPLEEQLEPETSSHAFQAAAPDCTHAGTQTTFFGSDKVCYIWILTSFVLFSLLFDVLNHIWLCIVAGN